MKSTYKILVGKPEGKSTGGTRCRWEDNITMYLRKIGREGVDWIRLAQDMDCWRIFVNIVMNHQVI
jgi:hypothetical protein